MGSSPGPATFFSARRRDPDARRPKEQPQCALPHRGQRGSRTGARRARDLGSPSPSPSVEPAPSPPLEHNAVRRSGNGEAPTGRNRTGRHPTAGEGALRHQSFLMGGVLQTPGGRSNAPWGLPQRLEPGSSPPVGGSPRRQSHLARERRRRRPKNASPHGRERFDERALLSCLSYSELLELTPPRLDQLSASCRNSRILETSSRLPRRSTIPKTRPRRTSPFETARALVYYPAGPEQMFF